MCCLTSHSQLRVDSHSKAVSCVPQPGTAWGTFGSSVWRSSNWGIAAYKRATWRREVSLPNENLFLTNLMSIKIPVSTGVFQLLFQKVFFYTTMLELAEGYLLWCKWKNLACFKLFSHLQCLTPTERCYGCRTAISCIVCCCELFFFLQGLMLARNSKLAKPLATPVPLYPTVPWLAFLTL